MEKVIFSDDFCRIFGQFMILLLELDLTDDERSEILAVVQHIAECAFVEGASTNDG